MSVKESIPDECQELQEEWAKQAALEYEEVRKANDVLTQENKALNEENKKLKECWIKCQNCTNEMSFANEKLEIGYKAMKNSYIAQIKYLKEEDIKDLNNRLMTCKMSIAIRDTEINELKEENEKFKKDIDEMFESTEYGDDIIRDGYTKLDAIYEWANSHADCQQEEIVRLSEENKKLKEEIKEAVNVVRIMSKAEELNLDLQIKQNEEIKKLKEENEKLKKLGEYVCAENY